MDGLEKTLLEIDDLSADDLNLILIDVDEIDNDSISDAKEMVDNLSKFYYNEDFIKQHPNIKKRIDTELESLRILIKMRKSDERAHDVLLAAISNNNNNASLYRSLTEIQKLIISITTKMGEIVTELNNMMKGFQLELNFNEDEDEDDISTVKNTHRGSKDFINHMLNNMKKEEDE